MALKIGISVAVLIVCILVIALYFRHQSDARFVNKSFIVTLPEGWYEVAGETPRMFHRNVTGSGVLQISLEPSLEQNVVEGTEAEQELISILDNLGMVLGQRLLLTNDTCESGILATALYKSEKQGLLQFWLIPTRNVTVFASYTMGSLDTVKQDLIEARLIMKTLRYESAR